LALHTAGQAGGAQFYVSCYQITLSGGKGTLNPATVRIPGAYSSGDPGIRVNIHAALSSYVAPGPPVIQGGTTRTPGGACAGCASTCKVGSSPKGEPIISALEPTSPAAGGGAATGGAGACSAAVYQQCGGQGFSGCTQCAVSFFSFFSFFSS
jgi:hypothetical protein